MDRRFSHDIFVDFQTVCSSNRKTNAMKKRIFDNSLARGLHNKSSGNSSKFKRNSDFSAANHNKLSLVYMHKLGLSPLNWILAGFYTPVGELCKPQYQVYFQNSADLPS